MKKLCFLLLLGAAACMRQPVDHFLLRGRVPGAVDSTKVSLKIPSAQGKRTMLETYVVNEQFELRGSADVPTRSELYIDSYDVIERNGGDWNAGRACNIDFFVENGNLTFTTPHFDSLPQSFWKYDIRKEKNYKVTGSAAQDAYYLYQQQTIPLRHAIAEVKRKEHQTLEDNLRMNSLKQELDEAAKAFIRTHSNLAVNLYVVEFLKKSPFTYDQAYLDELEQLFATCQDTCVGLKNFRQYLHDAARFVQGVPLQDGEVLCDGGKTVSWLSLLNPDGYTLIDFWASWCAPCRASFPHLCEMYKHYGNEVRFLSLSIDQEKEEWQRAVEAENLPWTQLLCTPTLAKELTRLYDLRGVPTFLLIDSSGKIVFSGHGSGDLEIQLDRIHTPHRR